MSPKARPAFALPDVSRTKINIVYDVLRAGLDVNEEDYFDIMVEEK